MNRKKKEVRCTMAVWRKKIRIQQPATLSKAPSHIPHEIAEKSASRLPRSISGMHGMHAPRRSSSSLNCYYNKQEL
jgi:hypothetical protein